MFKKFISTKGRRPLIPEMRIGELFFLPDTVNFYTLKKSAIRIQSKTCQEFEVDIIKNGYVVRRSK